MRILERNKRLEIVVAHGRDFISRLSEKNCFNYSVHAFNHYLSTFLLSRWRNYQSLEGTSVKVTVVGTGKGEKKPDLEGFKKKLTERGRAVQAKRSVHEAAVSHAL